MLFYSVSRWAFVPFLLVPHNIFDTDDESQHFILISGTSYVRRPRASMIYTDFWLLFLRYYARISYLDIVATNIS